MELVIQESLPFAFGIAFSPMAIAAIILVLFSQKARTNSLFFLAGWALALSVTGVVVGLVLNAGYSMMGEANGAASETPIFGIIKLIFGLLLFGAAYWEWRNRTPKGEAPKTPKWMMAIEGITPGKTVALAVFLAMLPKNLMLNITSATTIVDSVISLSEKILVFVLFLAVANIAIAMIVFIYWVFGDRSENMLNNWKAWMIKHNSTVLIILYLVYGFILVIPQVLIFVS